MLIPQGSYLYCSLSLRGRHSKGTERENQPENKEVAQGRRERNACKDAIVFPIFLCKNHDWLELNVIN